MRRNKFIEFGKIEIKHVCPKRKSHEHVTSIVAWDDICMSTYACDMCGDHTDVSIDIPKCSHCGKRHHFEVREIGGEVKIDGKERNE